jgi:hypothetical protein
VYGAELLHSVRQAPSVHEGGRPWEYVMGVTDAQTPIEAIGQSYRAG